MNTLSAQVILDGATHAIGWDPANLEDRQKAWRNEAFSLALQEIWEAWWWEELMRALPMAGATVYNAGNATTAGTFYYFPGTLRYYLAVVASTGNDPATYANGAWTTNLTFWADAAEQFHAMDYQAGVDDTDLTIGTQKRCPSDGNYYQLTSLSQNLVFNAPGYNNVIYAEQGGANGKPSYWQISGDRSTTLYWDGAEWAIQGFVGHYPVIIYQSQGGEDMPLDVTGWILKASGEVDPAAQLTYQTYYLPPPSGNWSLLSTWTASVVVPGTVRAVTQRDPRGRMNPGFYSFQHAPDGVQIFNLFHGVPWIWYRRATPVIAAADYDATASYTALQADQITFDS